MYVASLFVSCEEIGNRRVSMHNNIIEYKEKNELGGLQIEEDVGTGQKLQIRIETME